MYLASMGFWTLMVLVVEKVGQHFYWKDKVVTAFLIVVALAYGVRAAVRNLDWRDPLNFFKKAITVAPNSPQLYHNLGSTLAERGRHREALTAYEQALRLKPDYMWPLIGAARSYLVLGEREKALEFYERGLKLKPDQPVILVDLAKMALNEGDLVRAGRLLTKILQTNQSFQPAWRMAGTWQLQSGHPEKAISFYRRAVKMLPEDDAAHNGLGVVYQRCLALVPGNSEVLNDLGVSLAGAGRVKEAAEVWRKILMVHPEFAPAKQNLHLAEQVLKTGK